MNSIHLFQNLPHRYLTNRFCLYCVAPTDPLIYEIALLLDCNPYLSDIFLTMLSRCYVDRIQPHLLQMTQHRFQPIFYLPSPNWEKYCPSTLIFSFINIIQNKSDSEYMKFVTIAYKIYIARLDSEITYSIMKNTL